ncbi:MAG: nitroreductase family deazaflavin-dependent oxidoreductase [Caldilineaceae bacterium]|nr:nitroreductase family deazaflavin-dependent oxidoreductase [Caldilineaceae bacterium]
MSTPLLTNPPSGILRWFLRAPIQLYRLGLGSVLGGRFLLLNHTGRKSGQAHQAVVEVVAHDRATDTYYIASGWGYKANWYKNLLASPTVTIQVGRRKLSVRAETLSPEAGAQILLNYRVRHPFAARELSRLIGLDIYSGPPEKLDEVVRESLPMIALRPRNQTGQSAVG